MNLPVITPNLGRPAPSGTSVTLRASNGQLKIIFGSQAASAHPLLTPKQTQVLKFVTAGLSNAQTADEMKVSIKTVEKHRQLLMERLGLHEITSLTRYAIAHGISLGRRVRECLRTRIGDIRKRYTPGPALLRPKALSTRQTQILKLIASGKCNKEIAVELNLSVKTIGNHRQQILRKLNIHEAAGLTRYAISKGLVTGTC